jgi:hypothetical protein
MTTFIAEGSCSLLGNNGGDVLGAGDLGGNVGGEFGRGVDAKPPLAGSGGAERLIELDEGERM